MFGKNPKKSDAVTTPWWCRYYSWNFTLHTSYHFEAVLASWQSLQVVWLCDICALWLSCHGRPEAEHATARVICYTTGQGVGSKILWSSHLPWQDDGLTIYGGAATNDWIDTRKHQAVLWPKYLSWENLSITHCGNHCLLKRNDPTITWSFFWSNQLPWSETVIGITYDDPSSGQSPHEQTWTYREIQVGCTVEWGLLGRYHSTLTDLMFVMMFTFTWMGVNLITKKPAVKNDSIYKSYPLIPHFWTPIPKFHICCI